jgi:hypothetical protein
MLARRPSRAQTEFFGLVAISRFRVAHRADNSLLSVRWRVRTFALGNASLERHLGFLHGDRIGTLALSLHHIAAKANKKAHPRGNTTSGMPINVKARQVVPGSTDTVLFESGEAPRLATSAVGHSQAREDDCEPANRACVTTTRRYCRAPTPPAGGAPTARRGLESPGTDLASRTFRFDRRPFSVGITR